MRLLILQLSDIHFKKTGNPIEGRLEQLMAAVFSIVPKPDFCLLLLTGDIAFSGDPAEFERAEMFLKQVQTQLQDNFGPANVYVEAVPGNHDCSSPKSDEEVRKIIVEGAGPSLLGAKPNEGYINTLLAGQSSFNSFYGSFIGRQIEGDARVARTAMVSLGGKRIRIVALNTALLSQRQEHVGTLYLPTVLVTKATHTDSNPDLVLCIYHHPDNWLEPNFRREFIKLTETCAHFVFTGHEHQQDGHWGDSQIGEQTVYIQADALQDEEYPGRSGFNAVVLNLDKDDHRYYHFRWKGERYSALIDGDIHITSLAKKSQERFVPTTSFYSSLFEDDFGFTHFKHGSLLLSDTFVYPPLSASRPSEAKSTSISGDKAPVFLLKQKCVFLTGKDRSGKTSLLKTIYAEALKTTSLIPVLVLGSNLTSDTEDNFFSHLWTSIRNQYGQDTVERFKQLPPHRRMLLIDNLHESRIRGERQRPFFLALRQYFGLIIVSSGELPDLSIYGQHLSGEGKELFSVLVTIRELSPSARGRLIDKWLRLDPQASLDPTSYIRELEREQNFISDLIRKRALPSLPYLVLGVLQIRQHSRENDNVDPSSFGYLFQRLVNDALASSKSAKKYIARKEGILRRFAYRLFLRQTEIGSLDDFFQSVKEFEKDIQVRVNEDAILQDLVSARVLTLVDGTLAFRHPYFFYYFVAKQLQDTVDGDSPETARSVLIDLTAHPLSRSSQLTLLFYLFFKRRDPIIEQLIKQAHEVFAEEPISDISTDVKFLDQIIPSLSAAEVDETVNVSEERTKRLEAADRAEEAREGAADKTTYRETVYSGNLTFEEKVLFSAARMEALGQVIRSFPDSLEGSTKIEILDCVFRLGLRTLHAGLALMAEYDARFIAAVAPIADDKIRNRLAGLLGSLVALFVRYLCSSALLGISQAVGASDIEDAYEAAIKKVGDSCATQLLNLTIKLDHSDGFPLVAVQTAQRRLSKESRMAAIVLSDLVQRHTQIFPLQTDTLRKIAGILKVNPTELVALAGKIKLIEGA